MELFKGIKQEQMTRTTVIQELIKEHNLKSYLEIGVQESANGSQINAEYKVGVDIKKPKNANQHFNSFYEGKSRNFFKSNKEQFDIVFIDGDHSLTEVLNDFEESIKIANNFIVLHDAYPKEQEATKWPNTTQYGTYNGEVYKLLLEIKASGFHYTLHKFDHGVLVIEMKRWKMESAFNNFDVDNIKNYTWNDFIETDFNKTTLDKVIETLDELETEGLSSVVEKLKVKKRKSMSQETKDKIKATKAKNNQ